MERGAEGVGVEVEIGGLIGWMLRWLLAAGRRDGEVAESGHISLTSGIEVIEAKMRVSAGYEWCELTVESNCTLRLGRQGVLSV